jgi:CheY-like chemotaxis protein
MNLVVNARDAMPGGGKLTVETANVELGEGDEKGRFGLLPGPHVMLAVSDTGQGMDAKTQAHIFEPFFTTKGEGKGTGLGLATVYGIVKQSGGSIFVYSEPGLGAAFKIYFPRVDGVPEAARVPEARASSGSAGETILLVEDNDQVRALTGNVLRSLGYRVLEARVPAEAIPLCESEGRGVHLLLTDVVMPGMNGRVLADRVKAILPETKVLFMSGYTDDAIVRHGVLAAGVRFLQKPFPPGVLARRVREALDAPS